MFIGMWPTQSRKVFKLHVRTGPCGPDLFTMVHSPRRLSSILAVQRPLPQKRESESVIAAVESAPLLCALMGKSLSTKGGVEEFWSVFLIRSCRGVRHCIRGILDEFAKSITLKAHCDLYTVLLDGALWTKDVVLAQREMKDDLPPQCELTLELDIPQPNKLDDRLQAFYCTLYTDYI